ncbi:polycystin-1 isoform X1 [Dunckerocampus dactyliophorus]|uniref:polycystin-1 isoform X1 n=1 Tax=Dunckerocampus dactyliophorus TaxID=161453 RepID=UPI002405A104|nr:polycystin-1 isoform X1 [Dunckerocampus dactyliophorus]
MQMPVMLTPQRQAWNILCVVLISTAGGHLAEDIPCPKGGQIHLPSLRCFWLSKKTSSWSEALNSCLQTHGGDVAAADLDLQNFIQHSFPVKGSVWVWLKGTRVEGPNEGGLVESATPSWTDGGIREKLEVCPQMALGTPGQWRTTPCSKQHHFFCENQLNEYLPEVDSYLVGVVLMTGIYHQFQIEPLPTIPDSEQHAVEMQLFPGLWFSHAGQLTSLELVIQPSPTSSLVRVQILRPYCSPSHHLVPPGCSSLLNPFSCCSAVPLCNTTGGCSVGQYWCHTLEACLPNSSPCSPYLSAAGVSRFALPPRYSSIPPFYHLVADLPLRIRSLSDLETLSVLLPEEAITVYPDDIVAIQHTRKPGTFLHCLSNEASLNSPWRQSYMSLQGTAWGGWWEGGLTSMPKGGHWVDGVVCNLRLLYTDTLHGTEEMFGRTETTAPSYMKALTPSVSSSFGLSIIHPPLDEKNQIHLQINVSTLMVVKVLRGENARCSWSAPVLQTGLTFTPSCTEALPECTNYGAAWFSSVTLLLPSVGVQTLTISVTDAVGAQSLNVTLRGYEGVSGLSVEPSEHHRMLVDIPQSFSAKVESGSSVTFSWVIDNLETFAYEGESYSVVFKKAAEYKLKVTASNPVSSQSKQLLLTADEMIPLGEPEFLFVREVVAVAEIHIYTLKVKVDIALAATSRWDFGDGSSRVIHTEPAPCETLEGPADRREKQVYVQHSVNFTYSTQGDYTLQVEVFNKYEKVQKSTKICVRTLLKHLFLDSSPLVPLVGQTFHLEATTDPASNNIIFTWDFGDKSEAVQGADRKVEHTFTCPGVYNISLCASNTLSVLNTWLMVEVMEEISGLDVSYNGPSELGAVTDFRAKVATGTTLIWDFDFGDGAKQGNLTDGSVSHIYEFPGNYTVGVTVSNSVSHGHKFIGVVVYRLAIVGMLPAECITSGRNTEFTALVSGNVSILAFHWLFGDELPVVVVEGRSTAMHTFSSPGTYNVNLTVHSSISTVPYNSTVCVETPVTDMSVQSSHHIAATGDEVCFNVLFSPEEATNCQFKWFSSSSSQAAVTETALKCFTFEDEGVQEVSVTVSNKVSSKTANTSITIQKPVSNFSPVGGSETVTVNTSASFWVASCSGSNVSVLWDFGDGFQAEQKQNILHVFTATGEYTVNATAFNAISQESVTLKVNVLHPVSDFSLQTNQPYGVVGEEAVITAASSDHSSTTYFWTVDGLATTQQGTYQFRFVFPKAAVYQVRAVAQNMVSRREASISVEVFERIEGLRVDCSRLINMTYLPTQEEVVFVATVTKGSNVTYRWLATQSERKSQMTAEGEHFHLVVERPSKLSIQLNASNNLCETTSITSVVAVERVTRAHVTTPSHLVAVGKLVNISVSVLNGSDLKYFWFVDPDLPPVETNTPYLLHRFLSSGDCFLQVIVQNTISWSNDTKHFIVQEEVQEVDFRIGEKMLPFYIRTNAVVSFQGVVHKGSDLRWFWKIKDVMTDLFYATNKTFIYIFPHGGVYKVSLNVSNAVNWLEVSHNVFVQDKIEGLILNISKHTLCTEEDVTFRSTISKGSNVSFGLTFENKDWMHSQDVVEGLFTTSILPTGTNFVKLRAWNQVSSAQVSNKVRIIENIKTLQLLSPSQHAIEALKEIRFVVDEQHGFPVNYTWIFHIGSTKMVLTGKEVVLTPTLSGSLSVSLLASNGVCSKMLNKTLTVEFPVQEVQIVCHSERIFTGHAVTFSAKVSEGTNLRYLWEFGDFVEYLRLGTVNHTFGEAGVYVVMVNISNSVSHMSTQLRVMVEVLECSSPQASLVQSQTTILRSRMTLFEASVYMNCSAYKATYQWELFRLSDCPNGNITGNLLNSTASPLLLLPKHSLDVGQYCLLFTVALQGTPLHVQRRTTVTVVHSPLVAVIKGGSHRLWPSPSDLVLDGSGSHDPDSETGRDDMLQYHWAYNTENSTNRFDSHGSIVTIPSKKLHPGSSYTFTLTVHKAGRTPASFTQTVTVSDILLLPVFVECVSCSSHTTISLAGHCTGCDEVQYKWSAEDETGSILNLDKVTASTGRLSSKLVLRSDVVLPGKIYTFTVNVTEPSSGRWGSASQVMAPNKPPYGGLCELNPESDVHLLDTVVTFNCSGWRDDDSTASELIYTFQVAPCHPTTCSLVTLYKGTRSSFGSMVPVGSPVHGQNKSLITVTLLIEGNVGTQVIALNRTLTVHTQVNASDWLRTKSQTELWTLVQHGNPQEIIPYSIALTSQLNQITPGQNTRELTIKREIRENVTKALVSLPISSLMDVDQISSALAQSTAVPAELVCDGCQEKVLEAVGKMIGMMEEHASHDVLSVFDTGRNILNIIGSSLTALSLSVSAPSSQQNHSRTPGAASIITLSALHNAGTLMRALIHGAGEVPLSFLTPYISTLGFHGDPSNLLCSKQSNQSNHTIFRPSSTSCPFHIPATLTTLLKSQRSELVQVVLGLDESHSLLSAANPPISTSLVSMEITTPQGEPVPIQDLDPEQAIQVTLHNKHPVEQGDRGSNNERNDGHANGTCPTVALPPEGRLNFTIKSVDGMDENAGLYISFNFSLVPGYTSVTLGHIRIEMTSGFQDSLIKEWPINLSALNTFTEKTVFLSPLLNRTEKTLAVNLTSSVVEGGPLRVSLCVFSSLCQYYSVKERSWSSEGLTPLEGSTLQTVHCLTRHLTMFGASLFVHPWAVVLLPPSGGPMLNVVAGIICAVLILIHLLVGLIAHKLDHLDSLRKSQVPLCGRSGLYHYRVLVKTGWRHGAGTTAHVGISLYGVNKSGSRHLQKDGAFQRGSLDQFHLETDDNLGEVWKIRIWHDNTGLDPSWYVQHVVVWDPVTDHMFFFLVEDWLSVENQKNGTVEKEILASCPEELTQFQRILSSQLLFGMLERHLWLSLWERPVHSRFTRSQRVTCSALMLHLYLALCSLWYGAVGSQGHSGPVSTKLLVNMETVAVGMVVAVLLFPLQCLICFLFRKAQSKVIEDMSVSPSPVCHSVEMDVYLGQSALSGPSFLSLSESSSQVRDSPSSLLESKAFDSSILDFWAASGLVPQTDRAVHEENTASWTSCDSLLKESEAPDPCENSLDAFPTRQLRRKKAHMQLHLTPPSSSDPPATKHTTYSNPCLPAQDQYGLSTNAHNHSIQTFLTLSEENLLMSIEAATGDTVCLTKSNSDSGRDSPTTTSPFSNTQSTSCSSWPDHDEDKNLHESEFFNIGPHACPSPYENKLYKCPSVLSVDSVASTFLPSPSPDWTRSSSTTRIGIARAQPSWLFPPWVLCMVYPLVAVLIGACLALVGIYGSLFSRTVVLMWLISALSALLTSALLLEPLKVCVQALIYTIVWRPVDPQVEDQLAQETTVVKASGEHSGKVHPPCGYGLLQAKEEARKICALRSLMRHCVYQLLFLLLVLLVNYQGSVELRQGRLLHSAVRRQLHAAPSGVPNFTSIISWSDAEQWMNTTLVTHMYHNPVLHLVGLPRLQYAHTPSWAEVFVLGNSSMVTRRFLSDLHMGGFYTKQFKTVSLDFTQYHRESGLFLCASIQLDQAQRVTSSLSIHPLLIPSSHKGLDLHLVLTVLLLSSSLLILFGEVRSMATERAQYLCEGKHWLQLLLAALSLATSVLQLCFLSQVTSCLSQLRSQPNSFINFHGPALLTQRSSQCAAILLTLLVLKLLGTLRFVQRWIVIIRVLQRAWKELWALNFLLLLLLLFCTHLSNTLFSHSVEGFLSMRQAVVSLLSILRGRIGLQRLCSVHPVLGPLYGLLLMGAGLWLLAKLFGVALIRAYRAEKADIYRPKTEPQDYEMVEFFIKRLKLWIGLTKAKEFRHKVKFEGMDVPPSRASRESRLSTLFSSLPSSHSPSSSPSFSSPRLLSSSLSTMSEDSLSEQGFDVQPFLDHLLPCVNALLSQFDRVTQITEDVNNLETELEEALTRRNKSKISNKEKIKDRFQKSANPKDQEGDRTTGEVRRRRTGLLYPNPQKSLSTMMPFTPSTIHSPATSVHIFPRTRGSHSECESVHFCEAWEPSNPTVGSFGLYPVTSPGFVRSFRRRAWHSGSSHSADAAQRLWQKQGGVAFTFIRPKSEEGVRRRISDGAPKKRKAWISEEPEVEQA